MTRQQHTGDQEIKDHHRGYHPARDRGHSLHLSYDYAKHNNGKNNTGAKVETKMLFASRHPGRDRYDIAQDLHQLIHLKDRQRSYHACYGKHPCQRQPLAR